MFYTAAKMLEQRPSEIVTEDEAPKPIEKKATSLVWSHEGPSDQLRSSYLELSRDRTVRLGSLPTRVSEQLIIPDLFERPQAT
jgi:hypothetical protein